MPSFLVIISIVSSVASLCTYPLFDAVSHNVSAFVPKCRVCRKHRVVDVVLLLPRDSVVGSHISQALIETTPSSLLMPSLTSGENKISDLLLRYAVVKYRITEKGYLQMQGQDFTVNSSAVQSALENDVVHEQEIFSDNETVHSSPSTALLKAMRIALSRNKTSILSSSSSSFSSPLSFFQSPSLSSQLLPVTLLIVVSPQTSLSSATAPLSSSAEIHSQENEESLRQDIKSTLLAVTQHGSSSRVLLTFVFASPSSVFGNASAEDRYEDCAGFNSEQTIQNLKKSNAARSLQQTLLSAGYRVRVFDQQHFISGSSSCSRRLLHHDEISSRVYASLQDLYSCSLSHANSDNHSSIVNKEIVCEDESACSSLVLPSCFEGSKQVNKAEQEDETKSYCNAEHMDEYGNRDRTLSSESIVKEEGLLRSSSHRHCYNNNNSNSRSCSSDSYTEQYLIKTHLQPLSWDNRKPFAHGLAAAGTPVILRGTQASMWSGLHRWSEDKYFEQYLNKKVLKDVKVARREPSSNEGDFFRHKFYDIDEKAKMNELLDIHLPYDVVDMNVSDFLRLFHGEKNDEGDDNNHQSNELAYYFTSLPAELASDVLPDNLMFLAENDSKMQMKYLWMSSKGVSLHTHFDQDHNFFVQVVGQKRFVLFSPAEQAKLYPFPRTHPLWHKAQADFFAPDLDSFSNYQSAHAYEAVLEPGDLLYVPPYWWHFVTALTPSISVSTWSKREHVEECMNYVYGHEHKFDMLSHSKGRTYALRLYLDMMVEVIYGAGQSIAFFRRLLNTRYPALSPLFLQHEICSNDPVPVARHVYGDTSLDVTLAQPKFKQLSPEIRDLVFMDYCEELVANVLSVEKSVAFFSQCFLGQTYAFHDNDDDGSYLWTYK